MVFERDLEATHAAYKSGKRIARENAIYREIITKAAFLAVANVHLEICYRAYHNDGKSWAQNCHGKMPWNENIVLFHHMKWAGFERFPKFGEYVEPIQDGVSIVAYGHEDFQDLMLGDKNFQSTRMQSVTSSAPYRTDNAAVPSLRCEQFLSCRTGAHSHRSRKCRPRQALCVRHIGQRRGQKMQLDAYFPIQRTWSRMGKRSE